MTRNQRHLAMIVLGAVLSIGLYMLLAPLDHIAHIRESALMSMIFFMALVASFLLFCTGVALRFDKDENHHGIGILAILFMIVATGLLIFCTVDVFVGESQLIIKVMNVLIDSVDFTKIFDF
ncbi:MAG: hypothetical protein RR357_05040 [Clostridia bacterium]